MGYTRAMGMPNMPKFARGRYSQHYYSTSDGEAEYCDERVCLCLCVFVCPR